MSLIAPQEAFTLAPISTDGILPLPPASSQAIDAGYLDAGYPDSAGNWSRVHEINPSENSTKRLERTHLILRDRPKSSSL